MASFLLSVSQNEPATGILARNRGSRVRMGSDCVISSWKSIAGEWDMDAEIRHARYIMSRLLLDCLRLIDEVRVRSGKLTNDEMIIGMAIIVLETKEARRISRSCRFLRACPGQPWVGLSTA